MDKRWAATGSHAAGTFEPRQARKGATVEGKPGCRGDAWWQSLLNMMDKWLSEFKKIGKDLFLTQLVTSHGGNLSIRIEDEIIITRSGAMLGHLTENDLVRLPMNFKGSHKKASKELAVHLAIYRKTPAKAVVHAHPPCGIALSLKKDLIKPLDAEGKFLLGEVDVIEVKKPIGSEELAEKVSESLKQSLLVMVKGHGSFARGETLEEAYHLTSVLETSAKIICIFSFNSQHVSPQK